MLEMQHALKPLAVDFIVIIDSKVMSMLTSLSSCYCCHSFHWRWRHAPPVYANVAQTESQAALNTKFDAIWRNRVDILFSPVLLIFFSIGKIVAREPTLDVIKAFWFIKLLPVDNSAWMNYVHRKLFRVRIPFDVSMSEGRGESLIPN